MSISKVLDDLNDKIKKSVDQRDISHYTHLRTALNNLLKFDLISDYTLKDNLTTDLENVLQKYKDILVREGRADTRGPLSKVRRLSDYFIENNNIDYDKLSVSEILLKSAKLKFNTDIYVGVVPKKNRFKIKEEITTVNEICTRIVVEGYELSPDSWTITDINDRHQRNGAASVIAKWFTGIRHPSIKIPDSRLNCIEKVLNLPKNILITKSQQLTNQATLNKVGVPQKNSKKKTNTRNAYVVKVLNPEFYEYYQQYSEYKIHSIAPETKYSLEATSKFSFGGTTVRELNPSGKESKWTPGNNGRNDNLQRFNVQLRAFCHYCVLKEGIKEEDVSLSHFTDSKLLERMKIWVQKEAGIGYVLFDSLLHLIKSNCGTRGFLRLCGNKGQRSTEEYFAELDHLLEEIPVWMNQIKEVKNNISKAPVGRKANVIHILRMPVEERIDLFKDIDKNLIEKSESNFQESLFFLKKSRSKKTPDSYRERLFRKSSSFINKAYQQSMTALIFNTSFKICPRLTNWATLNYFDSKLDNIYEVPSLTKVSKNQYQILIPLSGPNLMNLDNNVRYIKNAKFANTVPIDVTLHEKFSPTINQFLKIRKAYIDDYMEYHVDYHLKKLKNNKEVLIKSEGRCIYDASVLQYFFELMAKNLESGKAEDIEYFNKAIKLASIKLQEISTKKPTKKQLRRALNKVEPVLLQKTVLELSPYIIEKSKKELTPEIFELAKKEADKEIEAYANFNKDNVFALFPWVAEPKNYSIISATKILSGSQQESSLAASLERRGFVYNKTTMANLYKSETKNALNILIPELISKGINVHANRHLCAVTYLDLHPGKFGIVAAMINDTVIEVIKTYGNEDRETMMSQLSHVE